MTREFQRSQTDGHSNHHNQDEMGFGLSEPIESREPRRVDLVWCRHPKDVKGLRQQQDRNESHRKTHNPAKLKGPAWGRREREGDARESSWNNPVKPRAHLEAERLRVSLPNAYETFVGAREEDKRRSDEHCSNGNVGGGRSKRASHVSEPTVLSSP